MQGSPKHKRESASSTGASLEIGWRQAPPSRYSLGLPRSVGLVVMDLKPGNFRFIPYREGCDSDE
jgi:hypothetical protein